MYPTLFSIALLFFLPTMAVNAAEPPDAALAPCSEGAPEPRNHDDGTLRQWLSKSDLVVVGNIGLAKGALTDAIGDARYFATVRVLDVCKGDANLKGKTIQTSILRFELEDKDRHPLLKEDAKAILFLKKTGTNWTTADTGFGVQHPTPKIVESLKRLAKQEPAEQDGARQPATAPESKPEVKEEPKPESERRSQ